MAHNKPFNNYAKSLDGTALPAIYGRYVLQSRIAIGGMAEVFRARFFGAEGFEKLVAIKRMYPHLLEEESFVKMFINEARLAATLTHVNIVPIYDFGYQDKYYYIAMEYVHGCDLSELLLRCKKMKQPFPLGLAVWLLIEICEGLDYAHRKHDDLGNFLNLIHRDVTPQNILISYEGEVKIADFGIAKVQMLDRDETTAGVLKGKFSYMSPEQVRGERLDHRSDIFSLGIVAWEMLTEQKMFDGPNDYYILQKVREAKIIPPRHLKPSLPSQLNDIVMKALAPIPKERYQSVGEFRLELLRFLNSFGLFPSRAHLAAFVRKLFAERLRADLKAIAEETEKARKLWKERGKLSIAQFQNSPTTSSAAYPAFSPDKLDMSSPFGSPNSQSDLPTEEDHREDDAPTIPNLAGIDDEEGPTRSLQPKHPPPSHSSSDDSFYLPQSARKDSNSYTPLVGHLDQSLPPIQSNQSNQTVPLTPSAENSHYGNSQVDANYNYQYNSNYSHQSGQYNAQYPSQYNTGNYYPNSSQQPQTDRNYQKYPVKKNFPNPPAINSYGQRGGLDSRQNPQNPQKKKSQLNYNPLAPPIESAKNKTPLKRDQSLPPYPYKKFQSFDEISELLPPSPLKLTIIIAAITFTIGLLTVLILFR